MTTQVRFMRGLVRDGLFGRSGRGGALRAWALARRVAVVFAIVVCGVLGLGAGSAFAARFYPFDGQLAPAGGSFGDVVPNGVAVDGLNGDTYVASGGEVDVFETASGVQLASLGGSPAGSFGGERVAVAANDGTGTVYVLDSTHNVVDVFEANGSYHCQITGSATASPSECNGPAGSKTEAGGFNGPSGIAVDQATGEVYVVDANNGVVDVFGVGGAYVRQISLASIPGGFNAPERHGVAVDDFNGFVYVSNVEPAVVYVFNAAGGYETTWTGENTPAGSFGGVAGVSVAADNANGDVYVTEDGHNVIDVFEPSGAYVTSRFAHSFSFLDGVAVDQATGRVDVSSNSTGQRVVESFGPALVVPDVVTVPVEGVGPHSAKLNGTVNPNAIQLTDCHFDYGIDASYGQVAPCVPAAGEIPADSGVHAVSASIVGLTPGTSYHFRLQAENANGAPGFGEDASFATPPPPAISNAVASNVTASSVDLGARVNPGGLDTTYHFEWGTSTGYGTSVPVPDVDVGAGVSDVLVTTHLSGLSANVTYHWRVLARNASGTTTGVDHTFVYDTAGAGLPDNRAYEMVTPAAKNGTFFNGSHLPDVSEDGSRVILSSVQCFGDARSCTAVRLTEGQSSLFSRGSGGWVASPLAPPATGFETYTDWLVSADAGTELLSMPTPPAGEDDWYAREPGGSFVDVGPATLPSAGRLGGYFMGTGSSPAATADLSHVVWLASNARTAGLWPFDATLGPVIGGGGGREIAVSLYEYVGASNAQPVLVGVSGPVGSTDLISTCETFLGSGAGNEQPGVVSGDGRTVFFTAGGGCAGSGANAGAFVPVNELFARIDESRTVFVSGRSPVGCTGATGCASSPADKADFQAASVDGSKVFFTSGQQLTDRASEDNVPRDVRNCYQSVGVNGCNLYEYDFANPAGQNLLAVSAGDTSGGGPRVQGVVAASQDGSHVYFVARGVLSAAANSQGQLARGGAENLYVFERDQVFPAGHVAFIASLPEADEAEWLAGPQMANVTPDGRFLVFTSRGRLTSDDASTSGAAQVFMYDARSGGLVRVSIGNNGFNDNGNAGAGDAHIVPPTNFLHRAGSERRDPTMSHDGSFVFFTSPVALTPRALDDARTGTNERGEASYAQNVYEYHEGHVYLISDGRDVSSDSLNACGLYLSSVCLVGADASGANVFFTTADPLVAGDTDTQVDYYDARICTAGEPCVSSAAPSGVSCRDEACHGTPGLAPVAPGAATVTFAGPGNLAPPTVVKSKAKHRHRHRHRARAKRRAKRRAKLNMGNGHTKARG